MALPSQWAGDDLDAALAAYRLTVDALGPDWPRVGDDDALRFFETQFSPAPDPTPILLTGYYEPELAASLIRSVRFCCPLYALPPDPARHDRAEIETGGVLSGHEIAWVEDPLDAFLAQVQGSVRLRLTDGGQIRLGYAGKNGRPYRSIGAELIARGAVDAAAMSIAAIRDWCAAHPGAVQGLLQGNPSFVFFRVLDLPPDQGPLGALGGPLTPMRSLAVDPAVIPLGAPVWVETDGFAHLTIAQDRGSAIIGRGRADLYCGSGAGAGEMAGNMRLSARIVPFFPRSPA